MTLVIEEARQIVIDKLGDDVLIKSEIEYDGLFLFIAHRNDPFEGHLDPFFSVDPQTKVFRDFSPADYPEPIQVLNAFTAAAKD